MVRFPIWMVLPVLAETLFTLMLKVAPVVEARTTLLPKTTVPKLVTPLLRRSSIALAAKLIVAVPSGFAAATPGAPIICNTPAFTFTTPAILLLFSTPVLEMPVEKASVPRPFLLMLVPAPEIGPPSVNTVPGSMTVMLAAAGRVVAPLSVKLLAPSKVKLPCATKVLATALAELEDSNRVPSAIVRVPVPRGPLVTVEPTTEGVLLAPIMSPPALSVTPPVKVLTGLLNCSTAALP